MKKKHFGIIGIFLIFLCWFGASIYSSRKAEIKLPAIGRVVELDEDGIMKGGAYFSNNYVVTCSKQLTWMDMETGEKGIFCTDPNCRHNTTDCTSGRPVEFTCKADFLYYKNDRIYMYGKGTGEMILMSQKIDGRDRRKEASIKITTKKYPWDQAWSSYTCGNKIYTIMGITDPSRDIVDETGRCTVVGTYRMISLDMESLEWKEELYYEGELYNCFPEVVAAINDELILLDLSGSFEPEGIHNIEHFGLYNVLTGNYEPIVEEERFYRYIGCQDNYLYFLQTDNGNIVGKIIVKDAYDSTYEKVIDVPFLENKKLVDAMSRIDGGFVFGEYDTRSQVAERLIEVRDDGTILFHKSETVYTQGDEINPDYFYMQGPYDGAWLGVIKKTDIDEKGKWVYFYD